MAGAADMAIVLLVGGVVIVGGFFLMNNPGIITGASATPFGLGSRGISLKEMPMGYENPTLKGYGDSKNIIPTTMLKDGKYSTPESSKVLNDYVAGIQDAIGANYAYAYPGLKLGKQPNFIPPGHYPVPGVRRRRRPYRSRMAIHYE